MLNQDTRAILRSLAFVIVTVSHFTLSSSNPMFANIPSRGQLLHKPGSTYIKPFNQTRTKLQPAFSIPKENPDMFWFPIGPHKAVPAFLKRQPSISMTEDEINSKISYHLYTLNNQNVPKEIFINNLESIINAGFDCKAATIVIIHGFMSDHKDGPCAPLKLAYLRAYYTNVNIVCVDWKDLAKAPWYGDASYYTYFVGYRTARFIQFLVNSCGLNVDNVHLIGHSLGAHCAGFAGWYLEPLCGKVGRITGLDPAGPGFGTSGAENRLDSSHATHVQAIHTDAGGLGLSDPVGHADFYPNGGTSSQPGCESEWLGELSHSQCYYYFCDSIITPWKFNYACRANSWDAFNKGQCDSYETMGEAISPESRGNYYLYTP